MSDCYIIHAMTPQTGLFAFDKTQVLDLITDSDEKSGELCRNSSFEKEVCTNDRNDGDFSFTSFES